MRPDVVVVGLGAVGSAALHHLARRGLRAVGVDRFAPPHGRGSSHGDTRIIRKAYFEHPDYVPLLARAYALWDALAAEAGEPLFERVGVLQIGAVDGEVVPGVLRAAAAHGLSVDRLDAADLARTPIVAPPGAVGVLERDAGFLRVERCVAAHLAAARAAGAALRLDTAVTAWRATPAGIVVDTAAGRVEAGALVVAGGAWSAELLADLGLPLTVLRKPVCWFAAAPPPAALAAAAGMPCWLVETGPGEAFYGFPRLDALGVKVAEHSGGEPVAEPLAVDRAARAADEARLRGFLAAHLPSALGPVVRHDVCLYTMTPDHHAVIDRHPGAPQVAFAAGLSGHGFKLAPSYGEALADLVVDGRARAPIGFLSLARPALATRPPGPGA